jgi:two-component system LytT family sensor kinase
MAFFYTFISYYMRSCTFSFGSEKYSKKNIATKKEFLSLYWICQLTGWGLVSVYWAYTVYTRDDYGVFYTFLNYVLDASIGIFLTHMYRRFAIRADWSNLPIKKLLLKLTFRF